MHQKMAHFIHHGDASVCTSLHDAELANTHPWRRIPNYCTTRTVQYRKNDAANDLAIMANVGDLKSKAAGTIAGALSTMRDSCNATGGFVNEDAFVAAAEVLQATIKDAPSKEAVRELNGIPVIVRPLLRCISDDGSPLSNYDEIVGEDGILAAIAALQNIARGQAANKDAILQESKAMLALVALLSDGPSSELAQEALEALEELVTDHRKNAIAVSEANGAPMLVSLAVLAENGSRTKRQAITTLLHLARSSDRACALVGGTNVGAMLVEVIDAPKTTKTLRMLTLELLMLIANVNPNRVNLDRNHPTQALLEAGAFGTLLKLLEISAVTDGHGFEACRACDALKGMAQINGAVAADDAAKLVNILHATLIGERSNRPLPGDEGKKEYVRTQHEVDVERTMILQRGQGVLKVALPEFIDERTGESEQIVEGEVAKASPDAIEHETSTAVESDVDRASGTIDEGVSMDSAIQPGASAPAPELNAKTATVAAQALGLAPAVKSGQGQPASAPSALKVAVSNAERGTFEAVCMLFKADVDLSTIQLVLGENYLRLISIAERTLAISMSPPGDISIVFHALPLARALSAASHEFLKRAVFSGEKFLDAHPKEKKALEAANKAASSTVDPSRWGAKRATIKAVAGMSNTRRRSAGRA